ncbi:MAG: PilZ domain-containing protein [Pseudomonadota bacterium]
MADVNTAEGAPKGPEARAAERTATMLRHAKLVCQSGEYLCRIRDISALGVGLTFHHQVPPEPRILLQLANTLTYPIERVWLGKRQAGYRFGCEVSASEFVSEQGGVEPRALRLNISAPARINANGIVSEARLLDISCGGAKIASDHTHTANRQVGLQLAGLPTQIGTIGWLGSGTFGLRFERALSSKELANCALYLQPYGQPRPSGFSDLANAASDTNKAAA